MNFPIIEEYPFDIDGTNPKNKVDDELIVTKKGRWNRIIIPVHAPFFVESLVLTSASGELMVEGKHYRIFRMMGKLTEFCAKDVACLIELIDLDVTDVLASYQVVGKSALFDKSLLQLVNDALNDDRNVLYENVANKPPAFPPVAHGHSLVYEIVAFQDMVSMLDELLDYMSTGFKELLDIKLTHIQNLINFYIDTYTAMLKQFLANHEAAYNAHGLTATQAGGGLIENHATATTTQALQGERDDLVLTTAGLKALMEEYGYNPEFFLETNIIPLSRYGSRNFIPPTVDGSFEGLGSELETAGMCLETDGSVTYLSSHWDGRTTGLYYNVVEDYTKGLLTTYTSYKYSHQKIIGDGQTVDFVCGGTNHEVILMGKAAGGGNWYVGLTHGTLNPAKHVLSRVNLGPLNGDIGGVATTAAFNSGSRLTVHLAGDWIYFIITTADTTNGSKAGYNSGKRFYRAPVSAVALGDDVTPQIVNLTYTNWDGKKYTNSPDFIWAEATVDANGRYTRCVYNFNPPITGGNFLYRSPVVISCPVPGSKNIILKFLSHFWTAHADPGVNNSVDASPELLYEFNPDTGVMTLLGKSLEPTSVNLVAGTRNLNNDAGSICQYIVANYSMQTASVLPNGDVLYSFSDRERYPHALGLYKTGMNNAYETMKLIWSNTNFPNQWTNVTYELPVSPLNSGIQPNGLTYDNEGEIYVAREKGGQGGRKPVWHREVQGDYATRDGINNLRLTNIKGRPLGGLIRRTNLDRDKPRVNITGTAAQLSAYGLNMGITSFGMNIQKKIYDANAASGWAAIPNADDIVCITDYSKTVTPTDATFTPTADTYWPASINAQLMQELIPAQYANTPDRAILVIDFADGPEAKIGAMPVMVCVYYLDRPNTTARACWATIRPTYSARNGIRRTVTGYTILDRRDSAIQGTQTGTDNWRIGRYGADGGLPSGAQVFLRDDGLYELFCFSGWSTTHIGNSAGPCSWFTINKTTGIITSDNLGTAFFNNGAARLAIPKVGFSTSYEWGPASGSSALCAVSGSQNFLIASVYPEVGWTVYFQKEQNVVFNGVPYVLPIGTIDLRDIDPDPSNKTFYIYTELDQGKAKYQISEAKISDSPFHIWIGTITTSDKQILLIERFNVQSFNGQRVSEIKRGSSIPASSGSINSDGSIPWLRTSEIIPG